MEDGDGLFIDDKFLILSLEYAVEIAMCGIILQDHVIEVNKWVTDGNNIHFARVDGSLRDLLLSMAKFIHSDFYHHVSWMRLALSEKKWLFLGGKRSESIFLFFDTRPHVA